MGHTQPAPAAHPPAPQGAPHAEPSAARTHVTVAVILACLTLIAFGLVWTAALPLGEILPVLLVLAFAQIVLQTLYYMRLRVDDPKFRLFFGGGVALAVVISVFAHLLLLTR
jgi:heme/copper-type cytochrome/quinol oxidase subunit 4